MKYDDVLAKIPEEFQNHAAEMDAYLKALRPLKFKRMLDKGGKKIKYVASDYGISYTIFADGPESDHHFGWYYVFDKAANKWYRKNDCMEKTLNAIAKNDSLQAARIFESLKECSRCRGDVSCGQTVYRHNGQERTACYGRVILGMSHEAFSDAREFFRQLNALMADSI